MSDDSIVEHTFSVYQNVFRARVKSAIEMAKAVDDVHHAETKGLIREILVRELFQPLLPPDIGIGTGLVIDMFNNISPQTDIVIFSKTLTPSITIGDGIGLYPIDSCLLLIEVKTKLKMEELKKAHANAMKIDQTLIYSPPNRRLDSWKARYLLFAFDSDLAEPAGKNRVTLPECQRYRKLYTKGSESRQLASPPIRGLCVVGREYGHERDGKWEGVLSDSNFNEVLVFIGCLINIYRDISNSRQSSWMEHYLFSGLGKWSTI
jgi:hypothetical protein